MIDKKLEKISQSASGSPSKKKGGGGSLQVIDAVNQIACTGSPVLLPLTTTCQQNVFCQSQLCAVITDCAPFVNIPSFGPCAFTPMGSSPSGGPCVPKPIGTWTPGASTATYDRIAALRQADRLPCAQGGVISVANPGQTILDVE